MLNWLNWLKWLFVPDAATKQMVTRLAGVERAVERSLRIEAIASDLLELYDWRNELGRQVEAGERTLKQQSVDLREYGRNKKRAWAELRDALDS